MDLITESRLRNLKKSEIPNPYPVNKSDKLTPSAKDFLRGMGVEVTYTNKESDVEDTNMNHLEEKVIPVGVSNRHIHLSEEDIEMLFGKDHTLTQFKELSQPGQFAANETATLIGPKGIIQNVRVLGPARGDTQIEISKTDGFQLGIHPPVRLSGSIEDTPGITVVGPKGSTTLSKGIIVAKRHVHMSPEDMEYFNVEDGDELMVKSKGDRPTIFTDVSVRVDKRFFLDFHIDMDEANGSALKTGDLVQVIGKNNEFFF